jgi:hypothetical protein
MKNKSDTPIITSVKVIHAKPADKPKHKPHVSRITHVRNKFHIVVSRDRHGNRIWLGEDGWTSNYSERKGWIDRSDAVLHSAAISDRDHEVILEG